EVESERWLVHHGLLDAPHLLLDMRQPCRKGIAGAMHDEGRSECGSRHQTALPMNFSASSIRSSPEMSFGSNVSRRAARVRDSRSSARSRKNDGHASRTKASCARLEGTSTRIALTLSEFTAVAIEDVLPSDS